MSDQNSFKKWYHENKVLFNAKRKAKYASDKDMREKAVLRQREYRKNNPARLKSENTRVVGGREQPVYRIGAVAEAIGRTEQVVRLWEANGIIPKPTVPGTHRYYTQEQVDLLKGLAQVFDEVRYKPMIRAAAISKKSSEVHLLWGVCDGN